MHQHFTPGLSPRNAAAAFVPMAAPQPAPVFTPWPRIVANDPVAEPEPEDDPFEAIRVEAFEAGIKAGRATLAADITAEREAVQRLAQSLQSLRPEPSGPLALLLVEAVDRLVRQVVGEVAIDPTLLLSRAHAAAALIAEEARPSALRLHPDDHARLTGADLPVVAIADSGVAPGSVVMETAEGWVEDGIAARLDALRGALTKVAA